MTPVNALMLMVDLTTVAVALSKKIAEASRIIRQAQDEKRDLTPDEIRRCGLDRHEQLLMFRAALDDDTRIQ